MWRRRADDVLLIRHSYQKRLKVGGHSGACTVVEGVERPPWMRCPIGRRAPTGIDIAFLKTSHQVRPVTREIPETKAFPWPRSVSPPFRVHQDCRVANRASPGARAVAVANRVGYRPKRAVPRAGIPLVKRFIHLLT